MIKQKVNIKEQGFTLIEVMTALVLVAALVIAFLPVIGSSYSGIMKTGNNRKTLYDMQADLESNMAEVENKNLHSNTVHLEIPDEGNIAVEGEYLQKTLANSHKLTVFVAQQKY